VHAFLKFVEIPHYCAACFEEMKAAQYFFWQTLKENIWQLWDLQIKYTWRQVATGAGDGGKERNDNYEAWQSAMHTRKLA
jgi:adenosine deaminase